METYHKFKNREQAAIELANALDKFKNKDTLVLAIPKEGLEIGYFVASLLNAEFAPVISEPLPIPGHPAYHFGAITEEGFFYITDYGFEKIPAATRKKIIIEQDQLVEKDIRLFRKPSNLPPIKGKQVIIVNEGISDEAIFIPVIDLCAYHQADKIIIAAPVGCKEIPNLKQKADEVMILKQPEVFINVAEEYENYRTLDLTRAKQIMKDFEEKENLHWMF
jgi:putative phosphoribosyl transferase